MDKQDFLTGYKEKVPSSFKNKEKVVCLWEVKKEKKEPNIWRRNNASVLGNVSD